MIYSIYLGICVNKMEPIYGISFNNEDSLEQKHSFNVIVQVVIRSVFSVYVYVCDLAIKEQTTVSKLQMLITPSCKDEAGEVQRSMKQECQCHLAYKSYYSTQQRLDDLILTKTLRKTALTKKMNHEFFCYKTLLLVGIQRRKISQNQEILIRDF